MRKGRYGTVAALGVDALARSIGVDRAPDPGDHIGAKGDIGRAVVDGGKMGAEADLCEAKEE